MRAPRFFTSAYDISANGAASPGRWHDVQLLNTIGAMCSEKVSELLGLTDDLPTSPPGNAVMARAHAAANIVKNRFIFLLLREGCNSRSPGSGAPTPAYRS